MKGSRRPEPSRRTWWQTQAMGVVCTPGTGAAPIRKGALLPAKAAGSSAHRNFSCKL